MAHVATEHSTEFSLYLPLERTFEIQTLCQSNAPQRVILWFIATGESHRFQGSEKGSLLGKITLITATTKLSQADGFPINVKIEHGSADEDEEWNGSLLKATFGPESSKEYLRIEAFDIKDKQIENAGCLVIITEV